MIMACIWKRTTLFLNWRPAFCEQLWQWWQKVQYKNIHLGSHFSTNAADKIDGTCFLIYSRIFKLIISYSLKTHNSIIITYDIKFMTFWVGRYPNVLSKFVSTANEIHISDPILFVFIHKAGCLEYLLNYLFGVRGILTSDWFLLLHF